MLRRASRVLSFILAGALFVAGCDDAPAQPAGVVNVFAATSLTNAFTDIGKGYEKAFPGTKVTLNFGSSSALAQQIVEGGKADVFASADDANMAKVDSLIVRPPRTFVRNRLVIVTKPGNPAGIKTVGDLASADVVSLCAVEVPCGRYAEQLLRAAGVTIDESHVTRGQNVAATLTAVAEGDAVAGIVYVTDAQAATTRVASVRIPAEQNVIAGYPIASLRASTHQKGARAFIAFVRSPVGQQVLLRDGFLKA